MPWKYLHASVKGAKQEECHDYYRVGVEEGAFLAIVCDGAGSAEGARFVADSLYERLKTFPQDIEKEILDVKEMTSSPTTLMGALLREEESLFFQIGDGAIVFWEEGIGSVVFWPKEYEYANETAFITDEILDLKVARRGPVKVVALLTDGLQRLALEYATQTVFERFFTPFKEMVGAEANGAVSAFLNSEAVNQRTYDDKTLIVARYVENH